MKTLSLSEFSELCSNGSLSGAKYEFNADDQCEELTSLQHTFRIVFDRIEIGRHSRIIRLYGDAAEFAILYVVCVRVSPINSIGDQKRMNVHIVCENCLHPENEVEYFVTAIMPCEK